MIWSFVLANTTGFLVIRGKTFKVDLAKYIVLLILTLINSP